jgi:uncharacterized protein YidB (DUF937 family)
MDDRPTLPGRQADSADPMAAIGSLVSGLQNEGGLDALVGKLRAAGLGGAVDSWVSTGANQPVEPARLGDALGPDAVNRLSSQSGLSVQALLPMLAMFLPQIIDMLTPDGTTPSGGLNDAATTAMPDLGGLLGGLLGGSGGTAGQAGLPDLGGLLGGLGGVLGDQNRR